MPRILTPQDVRQIVSEEWGKMPTTAIGYVTLAQAVMRKRHVVMVQLSPDEYDEFMSGITTLRAVPQ